jgi:hypothetical protein
MACGSKLRYSSMTQPVYTLSLLNDKFLTSPTLTPLSTTSVVFWTVQVPAPATRANRTFVCLQVVKKNRSPVLSALGTGGWSRARSLGSQA